MTTKYTICFARPVFEKLSIEIAASSEEEAIFSAVHSLMTDSELESQWSGAFDDNNYTGFVESIITPEDSGDTETDSEPFGCDRKYLILQADMDTGQGGIIPQPWLMPLNPFMIADLCQDWTAQLAALEQGELDDYVKTIRPEQSATIIPFPNPDNNPEL